MFHDPTLDRTTDGKGAIKEQAWFGNIEYVHSFRLFGWSVSRCSSCLFQTRADEETAGAAYTDVSGIDRLDHGGESRPVGGSPEGLLI